MARKQTLIQKSRGKSSAEKAAYHDELGAGRSHVKRRFFDLSTADEEAIVARIAKGLDQTLRQTG